MTTVPLDMIIEIGCRVASGFDRQTPLNVTDNTASGYDCQVAVLLHNGGSFNACTVKRSITLLCIPKQSP
jgi:hypothetical protein